MTIEWPEGIAELEEFVRSKELYFACRGPVPHSGGEIRWQYGNDKIAVLRKCGQRIRVERSKSEVAGWAQQWWVASELQELISGGSELVSSSSRSHSVTDDMRIIQENWDEIVDAFAPQNRSRTHTVLKSLRAERAQAKVWSIDGEIGKTLSHNSYRNQSSSSMPRSVFSSRYFTMTGVDSERFHSAAAPFFTARDPGTTTAFSGTSSDASAVAR